MADHSLKTLSDLVKHLGTYPEEAFHFVREGLGFAAEQIHGPETEAHRRLYRYLSEKQIDWTDLVMQYQAGQLPKPVVEVIDEAGGCDKLDRHVSGRQLCWSLRDYAVQQWGMLARTVLESWSITRTSDFGRIVFGFIGFEMMQKQPGDKVEDFDDVYSFDDAFNVGCIGGQDGGEAQPG